MTTLRKFYSIFLIAFALQLTGCGEKSVSTEGQPAPSTGAETTDAGRITSVEPGNPNEQEAALLAAAAKGETGTVKALLDKGVNVNVRDRDTSFPLANAIWFGHVDTVRVLMDHGADLNARKNDGATPMLLSQWSKHPEITEILKKAGAK
jgi:uncharacterized protein